MELPKTSPSAEATMLDFKILAKDGLPAKDKIMVDSVFGIAEAVSNFSLSSGKQFDAVDGNQLIINELPLTDEESKNNLHKFKLDTDKQGKKKSYTILVGSNPCIVSSITTDLETINTKDQEAIKALNSDQRTDIKELGDLVEQVLPHKDPFY